MTSLGLSGGSIGFEIRCGDERAACGIDGGGGEGFLGFCSICDVEFHDPERECAAGE